MELRIVTGESSLELISISGLFTGYPLNEHSKVSFDSKDMDQIWEVGFRTARLCAHETYFDCPYYEQLQYIGDTRIQALISYYVSNDDRLVKNAIEHFYQSQNSDGLTRSS